MKKLIAIISAVLVSISFLFTNVSAFQEVEKINLKPNTLIFSSYQDWEESDEKADRVIIQQAGGHHELVYSYSRYDYNKNFGYHPSFGSDYRNTNLYIVSASPNAHGSIGISLTLGFLSVSYTYSSVSSGGLGFEADYNRLSRLEMYGNVKTDVYHLKIYDNGQLIATYPNHHKSASLYGVMQYRVVY